VKWRILKALLFPNHKLFNQNKKNISQCPNIWGFFHQVEDITFFVFYKGQTRNERLFFYWKNRIYSWRKHCIVTLKLFKSDYDYIFDCHMKELNISIPISIYQILVLLWWLLFLLHRLRFFSFLYSAYKQLINLVFSNHWCFP